MNQEAIREVDALFQAGDYEAGLKRANDFLEVTPDDPLMIFMAGLFQMRMGRKGVAFSLFERAHGLKPDQPEILNNMGVCLYHSQHYERARTYYDAAYAMNDKDPDFLSNLCAVEVGLGNFEKAIYWGKKGLELAPNNKDILYNSGLAHLIKKDWKNGWSRYDVSLGNQYRQERFFDVEQKIPRWDGSKVPGSVVVYGEQGLGDEIMFASILPDAMKDANIILECDGRLYQLFQRSFPEIQVYPTRWADDITWPNNHYISAKIEAGGLGGLYRDEGQFPRTPYLVADPERRSAMRAMLDDLGTGPKVGIAWTGGKTESEQLMRNITLETLKPLLQSNVHWVDLEYKDRSQELAQFTTQTGIPINHFNWVTLNKDYDMTAALVAELDLVICSATTVGELAGALGVPCFQMSPYVPTWRVGLKGSKHPWYESVRVFRKKNRDSWDQVIKEVRECMLSLFADQAGTSAPVMSQG